MPGFKYKHYVPILKWKPGEQAALRTLSATQRSALTPLVAIDEIPINQKTRLKSRSIEQHAAMAVDALVASWGTSADFFLDTATVANEVSARKASGASYMFDEARKSGLQFIPVIGLGRPPSEIASALVNKRFGICLRITYDDFDALLAAKVSAFMSTHRLQAATTDLIVDLGPVHGQTEFLLASSANAVLRAIPSIAQWRTLTLAASGFPAHMGLVPTSRISRVPRLEWRAWVALHKARATLPRMPTFGDYGIQHPVGVMDYDPRIMASSAAIRYTLDSEWLLVKGNSTRKVLPTKQYPLLAKQLMAQPEYYGATHSIGCRDIKACAGGAPKLSSPAAWRRIGTAHHLVVVTNQIATIP